MAPRASWLSASTAHLLPSQPQAALAIAILRSKQRNVSVRDYLIQLRQHVKQGPSPCHTEDRDHYLDTANYWQDQFQRLHDECEKLKSINVKLERSNQLLTSRMNGTPDNQPATATLKGKRRAPAPPTKSSKRRKEVKEDPPADSVANKQDQVESDFDFLESLGEDGANLLEGLYNTHQLCRSTERSAETLCHILVRTTSALAKVICLIAHNYEQLSRHSRRASGPASFEDDRSDFALALTASARAFMSILVGIAKMVDTGNDNRLPSLVVCELANMFKVALLAIETCARRTAEVCVSAPTETRKSKTKEASSKPKESAAARSLAHFLIGLLGMLDEGNITHHKIFDGFVFILLERVGRRLYFCTFGRHRDANIERSLLPYPKSSDTFEGANRESEALGLRLEVKALILILQRAMGLAPHHMKQPNSKSPHLSNSIQRTLSMKNLPSAPKSRLSVISKERLQRTLITCMYGGKSDDEFLDVLMKPVPSMQISSLQNLNKLKNEEVDQWYKEEVWRLIGWDVLAKEGCW